VNLLSHRSQQQSAHRRGFPKALHSLVILPAI
jgi:hypothetical protein